MTILGDVSRRGVSTVLPTVPGRGFIVVDTETTGLHDPSRVIEIALVWVSTSGTIQESWSTLIRGDGTSGGPRLERIHGIKDRDLLQAPAFKEIATPILAALSERIPIGHNAKFDRARLNYELRLIRKPALPEMACTMNLGRHLGYGVLRLENAIKEFGIQRTNAHRAEDDAIATAELLSYYLRNEKNGVNSYLLRKGFK
jgi:DNA polymerase-3 subunit epsilon